MIRHCNTYNRIPSHISTMGRVIMFVWITCCPVISKAYIGDYDGMVVINPIELKQGDIFSFNCDGADVECQRIEVGIHPAVTGKTDWTLILETEEHSIAFNTRKVERNRYDFDHDESIEITMSMDGQMLWSKDFGRQLPITRSPIYLRAQLNGKEITIAVGDGMLDIVGKVEYHGFVDKASVTSEYDIVVNRHSYLYIPKPEIPQIYADECAIREALRECNDVRCSIWEYFDEDVETDIAVKGGRYKVALLPSETGGYDIIYMSGAEIEPHRWCTGALKGHLIPTPFVDTYNLQWIDSAGKRIDDLTPYATIEGAIMSLVFPIQNAKFRFVHSN